MPVPRKGSLLLAAATFLVACGSGSSDSESRTTTATATSAATSESNASTAETPAPSATRVTRKTIATGLHVPWGIAFLPGGDALVAERTTGRILRVPRNGGSAKVAMTVPGVATDAGEGGLLGLAVSPDYAKDGLV